MTATSAHPMINALEETAHAVFAELRARRAGFCTCSKCRDDVVAHALNHLRPRYIIGSSVGSTVTRVALSHNQARTELAVVMLEAMRLISANPRHAPAEAVRGP